MYTVTIGLLIIPCLMKMTISADLYCSYLVLYLDKTRHRWSKIYTYQLLKLPLTSGCLIFKLISTCTYVTVLCYLLRHLLKMPNDINFFIYADWRHRKPEAPELLTVSQSPVCICNGQNVMSYVLGGSKSRVFLK